MWIYRLGDRTEVVQEIVVLHEKPIVVVTWRLREPRLGARLRVRPFLSGRDIHALHHENGAFRFDADRVGQQVTWRPYDGLPSITAIANGTYTHEPEWYREFLYTEERARGLDDTEDLASPGTFLWDLSEREAWLVLEARLPGAPAGLVPTSTQQWVRRAKAAERRRREAFPTRLHRAADSYLVRRGTAKTVIAGYPWFTDWGRDTFIALRGLCLSTGRLAEAREILLGWAGAVSEGMLPNRFVEQGDQPEFNSVDAALWYVVAVADLLEALQQGKKRIVRADRTALLEAIDAILTGYANGTRHGIRMDADGLLAAGVPGLQLTWMDAKVGDWVVTPRIGKPVEIQALWLNALEIGSRFSSKWGDLLGIGRRSFTERFWDQQDGFLYDVVDVDHRLGVVDRSFRPNQIFAVGGLPTRLLDRERAARMVNAVESRLWTPVGLRSLAPDDPAYRPRYQGGVVERDGSYHQGTVWPWLYGAFVDAWVGVRGRSKSAKREARQRFLQPILQHLDEAGIGHVSEIADADAPHTPRGCPFQAWSVGEMLRVLVDILGERDQEQGARGTKPSGKPAAAMA